MNTITYEYKFGAFSIPKMFILHHSKHFFTMIPPNPILKGHVIICSKRMISSLSEMNNEEIFDYSLTLQFIAKRIEIYNSATAVTISLNEGEVAGQSIPHFHVHVIPRIKGDLKSNDDVYLKIARFDSEFVKEFTDLLNNEKNKMLIKEQAEKFGNFIQKTYIC